MPRLKTAGGNLVYNTANNLAMCGVGTACAHCNTGTTPAQMQAKLPTDAGFINQPGVCTNCTALSGATILLTQSGGNACVWTATIAPGDATCTWTVTLDLGVTLGNAVTLTVASSISAFVWQKSAAGLPLNCNFNNYSLPLLSNDLFDCQGAVTGAAFVLAV
jgi:hypothetical protein